MFIRIYFIFFDNYEDLFLKFYFRRSKIKDVKKIIIAIDGFSSTGKSTIAKELAKALQYIYVDTGAMYRAVALFALRKEFIKEDFLAEEKLLAHLEEIKLDFKYNQALGFAEIYLNGENVEGEIRGMRVSQYVSKIAEIPEVRKKLVQQQQQMGKNKGVVMDGRDIGTVVFPQAELKLFMTASASIRAQRRYEELNAKGEKVTFEEVLENVEKRDEIDVNRKDSPLKKAEDAIEIDNSNLSRKAQFEQVLKLAQEKITT